MRSRGLANALISKVFVVITVSIFASLVGCSSEESTYEIEVQNKLSVLANVSLDGIQEQDVEAGETMRFVDVSEGTHILQAEASGFEPIEETVVVDRDIIWTIEER